MNVCCDVLPGSTVDGQQACYRSRWTVPDSGFRLWFLSIQTMSMFHSISFMFDPFPTPKRVFPVLIRNKNPTSEKLHRSYRYLVARLSTLLPIISPNFRCYKKPPVASRCVTKYFDFGWWFGWFASSLKTSWSLFSSSWASRWTRGFESPQASCGNSGGSKLLGNFCRKSVETRDFWGKRELMRRFISV